jgi:3,4-dihydroxy 2-butanone 4-phosphate synthase/GTP cyclohydrolase II
VTRLSVEEGITAFGNGEFVIISDDENRENEGDLAIAARFATPEAVNFMATYGRGLICVATAGERLDHLQLPLMVPTNQNQSGFGTAFTVSVEARTGVTTGISAFDRSRTIRLLADPDTAVDDLVQPGHVFPLRARDGGVLERAGQTEASVDLARLAGLEAAAAICEIMAGDGTMATGTTLEQFSVEHCIGIVTVADLIAHRKGLGKLVQRGASTRLPTPYGTFTVTAYDNMLSPEPDLALSIGDVSNGEPVLARVHSECLTGDVFGSGRCDCGDQLRCALQLIGEEGRGVVIYSRQEGRGIGLHNKLRVYALQDEGWDTVEANHRLGFAADHRTYYLSAHIIADLGIRRIRLLTNNPAKVAELTAHGIEIVERIPIIVPPGRDNAGYLRTKTAKMGHLLAGET